MKRCTIAVGFVLAIAIWFASSFIVGRGCLVTVDLATFTQTNTVEYVLPNTSIAVWRRSSARIDNQLLDYLADRYGDDFPDSSQTDIARFNNLWRDGHSMAYYPLVRERDRWLDWTAENPTLADFAWPRFLRYLDAGDPSRAYMLLRYADQSRTVSELKLAVQSDPEMQNGG